MMKSGLNQQYELSIFLSLLPTTRVLTIKATGINQPSLDNLC